MKILKLLFIISVVLLLIKGFAYFNIRVSEKYEVDLMTTHRTIENNKNALRDIEIRKGELLKQKKHNRISIIIITIIAILILIAIIIVYYKEGRSMGQN